jgi:hypothetical protein
MAEPRRLWAAGLAALVILRSTVFVFWPGSHFDSDQAVTGLMAKHLSELRAFPIFLYGQTYMLEVEAWLSAPVMALAGATVTALKLPLLAMNVGIALLLFNGLTRDARLNEARAAFATLFFVLAAPITAAHYLSGIGGNVEPSLYVLLLWVLRHRPAWFGLLLGIGFLNREFTIYAVFALGVLDAVRRTLFTRDAARHYGIAFGTAALTWIGFLILRQFSSAAGPGTSAADLSTNLAGNNLTQIAERLCLDPRAIAAGAGRLFTIHWPELFGLESQPLTDFGIESVVRQGLSGSAWLLAPLFLIPIVRIVSLRTPILDPRPSTLTRPASDFCPYLLLVAVFSVAGYVIGRCGALDFYTMRYELLSVLGAVALAGWYLRLERVRGVLAAWLVCCCAVFGISIAGHARLLAEYATGRQPTPLKQDLIRELDARNIRYAYADYWTSYYVSFMTRERIIVAANEAVKVRTYNRVVDAHPGEAIRISRRPCPGGQQLTAAFWSCSP